MQPSDPYTGIPKVVLIFCDGGFANRVGSLVSGMALAELLEMDYLVLWPRNNRCGAAFDELFIPHGIALQARLQDMAPYQNHLRAWMHEYDHGFERPVRSLAEVSSVHALRQLAAGDERPILFADNTFLPWLPEDLIHQSLNKLTFQPRIAAAASAITGGMAVGSYFGIHLRATDFIPPPPVEQMLDIVAANPQFRFFVCSDDEELETRFAAFQNVFVHRKSAYVEKLAAGAWKGHVLDSDGLPYTSNIDRTAASVEQACIDLLLLAASTPIKTSGSSFLALSEKMRASGFVERHFA